VLLLFDIDGTLVRTAGAGREALNLAFREVVGVDGALDGIRLDGNTDPLIYAAVFQRHFERGPEPDELDEIRRRYVVHLEGCLQRRAADYQVLPGVLAILEEAVRRGCDLGLCTGNIEAGARLKLRPGGLDRYFGFGGYGSDHADRAVLLQRAIERAQTTKPAEQTVVFGDTERDVDAARRVGVRSVGVRAGASDPEALAASRPDFLAESLDAPPLWTWLGWQD
jgi:phosphoglycolate phosphatase-like HAD superfamily hydrolase